MATGNFYINDFRLYVTQSVVLASYLKSLILGTDDKTLRWCPGGRHWEGTIQLINGKPGRVRLMVSSSAHSSALHNMTSQGAHETGHAQVAIPEFNVCLSAPEGVEITSASGHNYGISRGAARAASLQRAPPPKRTKSAS